VLNGADDAIQLTLIELAAVPLLGEFAKLFLGMIQPIAVVARKMVHSVGAV
jgi:hypothetical protein